MYVNSDMKALLEDKDFLRYQESQKKSLQYFENKILHSKGGFRRHQRDSIKSQKR